MEKTVLIQQAQVLVRENVHKKGLTLGKLSRQLKISAATLSNLCNNPDVLSEEALLKIINALAPKTKFKTVSTANFTTLQNACIEAKEKARMIGVTGFPGAGKTIGLDFYYRNNPNTYLVECNSLMNRRQFMAEILLKMGVSYSGGIYDMAATIINELNTRQNPLLILDEAGKLHLHLLLDIHYIRNATMNNAGILLAGVEYFYTNLKKAAQKQKQGMPEFFSRVQSWYELNLPTKKEVEAICTANGVTDEATIKEFQQFKNFRELQNAILNETDND